MITLKEIQTAAVTLIAAHPFFAGETVLNDQGNSDDLLGQKLEERGFAVVVVPVLGGAMIGQGKDRVLVNVDLMVTLYLNPKTNPESGRANKDMGGAIESLVAAMLEYDRCEKLPHSKFKLASDAFNISTFDGGLFAYDVFFQRQCVL
jgi:hypothetical protein